MTRGLTLAALVSTVLLLGCGQSDSARSEQAAPQPPAQPAETRSQSAAADLSAEAADAARPGRYALSTEVPAATEAGVEILEAGGNAFDAAVAISAALAVAEPAGSGIGGGGFWLLHNARTGESVMVDGREEAPSAATATLYQREDGSVDAQAPRNGPLGAAIPGEPAALAHIAAKYGRLPLRRSLRPAIRLARDGFPADDKLIAKLGWRSAVMNRWPATRAVYFPDNALPQVGTLIKQPDLADTLQALADAGHDGFYSGPVAKALVDGVRAAGGIWTLDDLNAYAVRERAPVVTEFAGHTITAASPPSSGGVMFAQVLGVLAELDWLSLGRVDRVHVLVEALRTAYRDRAAWLGDPDHVDMPLARLTGADYVEWIAARVPPEQARRSSDMVSPVRVYEGGTDTTHFSVMDADGNRVSATLSINLPFGSGFIVPGTGVLLNDEMDDFSAKPGAPNAYGLVGTDANAVGPGRRPLSSMTPVFIESDERVVILGTPGGSRIITMNLLGALAAVQGATASEIVAQPRYHHQYLPDEIYFEPEAFSPQEQASLKSRGHAMRKSGRLYGNMHAVVWKRQAGKLQAAADPRGIGTAAVEGSAGP